MFFFELALKAPTEDTSRDSVKRAASRVAASASAKLVQSSAEAPVKQSGPPPAPAAIVAPVPQMNRQKRLAQIKNHLQTIQAVTFLTPSGRKHSDSLMPSTSSERKKIQLKSKFEDEEFESTLLGIRSIHADYDESSCIEAFVANRELQHLAHWLH